MPEAGDAVWFWGQWGIGVSTCQGAVAYVEIETLEVLVVDV